MGVSLSRFRRSTGRAQTLFWASLTGCLIIAIALSVLWRDRMIHEHEVLVHLDKLLRHEPVHLYSDSNGYQLADARMSVFCSRTNWVIVFELIQFSYLLYSPSERFHRAYYLYGNCLRQEGFLVSDSLWEQDDHCPFDMDGNWQARRDEFWYYWQGVKHILRPTAQEYQAAHIDPTLLDFSEYAEYLKDRNYLAPIEWLRFLSHHLSHPFFASEARLREILRQAMAAPETEADLKLALQTCSWKHPDVALGETPSMSESFRLIAQIISTGDSELWAQSNTQHHNSHWSYWEKRQRLEEPNWMIALNRILALYDRKRSAMPPAPANGFVIVRYTFSAELLEGILNTSAIQVWQDWQHSEDELVQWLRQRAVQPLVGETFAEWLVRAAAQLREKSQ